MVQSKHVTVVQEGLEQSKDEEEKKKAGVFKKKSGGLGKVNWGGKGNEEIRINLTSRNVKPFEALFQCMKVIFLQSVKSDLVVFSQEDCEISYSLCFRALMKSYLSGMPKCKFGISDKIVIDSKINLET